jgi:hypothetical protein
MRKESLLFADTLPSDGGSGLAPASNDGYQSEETTVDRMLRQFKSGLFGVLYISARAFAFWLAWQPYPLIIVIFTPQCPRKRMFLRFLLL